MTYSCLFKTNGEIPFYCLIVVLGSGPLHVRFFLLSSRTHLLSCVPLRITVYSIFSVLLLPFLRYLQVLSYSHSTPSGSLKQVVLDIDTVFKKQL